MTDEELERHLRAWYRDEIAPDETAPHSLRSVLGTIPVVAPSPWSGTGGRRRIGMLSVAAVLTTLIGGGLLVGSGTFRRSPDTPPSDPAFVAPTPFASAPPQIATPVPTPSRDVASPTPAPTPFAPPGPCDTGKGQFLAGDTRPRSAKVAPAELSTGKGVYVAIDETIRSLWTVGPDGRRASLVAGATPASSDVAVLEVSPHRVAALVRVTLPPTVDRDTPGCSGLYQVQLDGTYVRQLTTEPEGGFISGAAWSPDLDGSRIAYVEWSPARVIVRDLSTGSTLSQPCETGSDANDFNPRSTVAWSPDGTKIAAECQGFLFIVDATGATEPFMYPRGEYSVAFRWADADTLVVARDPGLLGLRGTHVDFFDVPSRTVTVSGRVVATNIEDEFRSFSLSPDGSWLMFKGAVLTAVPADELAYVWYIVPATGGAPTRILSADEADSFVGWSDDGHGLVFIGPHRSVIRIEVDNLERTVVGTVPDGYDDGVWLIP